MVMEDGKGDDGEGVMYLLSLRKLATKNLIDSYPNTGL